jgi:hypothetical protein
MSVLRAHIPGVTLALCLAAIAPLSFGQRSTRDSQSTAAPVETEAPAPEETADLAAGIVLEEVVVYGDRTLNSLRMEVYRAEEAFYDAFNAVNSNDEYDISCERRAMTGSHMLRRVCEARFVSDMNEDFAQAWLRGEPLPPINPMLMYKGNLLVEEIKSVAREDPLVQQSLIRLAETQQRFDEEHERRCGGRILFCRR